MKAIDMKYKIAIIGGGANGVSVLNELVNHLSKTPTPTTFEVTLYEKTGTFGAGLAYGTHLDAHILNMPVGTMSAVAGQPEHFLVWLQRAHDPKLHPYFSAEAKSADFVPRRLFGLYLKELYRESLKHAEASGIRIDIVNEEVIDLLENGREVTVITGPQNFTYDQIILCLGNHPPTFGEHLRGIPGYFHHAWPEMSIMEGLPNEAPVCVIGSGLTAIDVLITLQEKGHTGPITLLSRHGILPKVRILTEPHELAFLNPENIRALTKAGQTKLSLEEVAELFVREFESVGVRIPSLSEILNISANSVSEVLKKDIEAAEKGNVKYFPILKAVDEVAEVIWDALSLRDRQRFDLLYSTLWNAYDYAMPLQNARRVLKALDSKQLKVEGGFLTVEYDFHEKVFKLICANQDQTKSLRVHKTQYVINATGQGLNLRQLKSSFIRNALSRGTVTPHLLGGLDVDFKTSAVRAANGKYSDRVYAVGSLTKGVHFYTNSINSNARCGKRVIEAVMKRAQMDVEANNIRGLTVRKASTRNPRNIALFVGSDLSSHLLLNDLVPQLVKEGFRPYLYFPKQRPSRRTVLPELLTQSFLERTLITDYVYPFVNEQPLRSARYHSPQQLGHIYGITVKNVNDINNSGFIQELETEDLEAGISIRCYQKFGRDIIRFFHRSERNFLWNLHPGILPQYQGVMTLFRAMYDGQSETSYSLHIINEAWDDGPLIDVRPQRLDTSKAMLTNYCLLAPSGVPIIVDNLNKVVEGRPIEALPQRSEAKNYYTFPNREEMDAFLAKGLKLVDPGYVRAILLANFSVEGTLHHRTLAKIIDGVSHQDKGTSKVLALR